MGPQHGLLLHLACMARAPPLDWNLSYPTPTAQPRDWSLSSPPHAPTPPRTPRPLRAPRPSS